MSFLDRLFGNEHADDEDLAIEPVREQELTTMAAAELARLEATSSKSIALPINGRASVVADELVPLAANAVQAIQTYDMAVVKFPEGVTWADLCVRKSDGWNLLSNFKGGKFNGMAGIKQAGLQPVAVTNLALQGAAVAVGMAYMNEISGKLDGIQSSVNTLQRDMERERDSKLKAAYDSLVRLATKYDEYGSSSELPVALNTVEKVLNEADVAWNYQLGCISDYSVVLKSKKKMSEAEIISASEELEQMENRAAAALQLTLTAQQIGMSLNNNYTKENIDSDLQLVARKVDEFAEVRGTARQILSKRVSKVGGRQFALADCVQDDYEAPIALLGVLHEGKKQVARVNPVSMHKKAKRNVLIKRSKLRDKVSAENVVSAMAESYEEEMSDLSFAFNEADTVVFDGENLRLFKTSESAATQLEEEA